MRSLPNPNLAISSVYKGAPSLGLTNLEPNVLAAAVVGTATVIMTLSILFWIPFAYAKVVKKDYSKYYIGILSSNS